MGSSSVAGSGDLNLVGSRLRTHVPDGEVCCGDDHSTVADPDGENRFADFRYYSFNCAPSLIANSVSLFEMYRMSLATIGVE